MAITKLTNNYSEIYGNKQYYTPLTPDNYLIVESNKTGETNFYFKIEIKTGSVILATYDKLVPNSHGRLSFNLSTFVRNYLIEPVVLTKGTRGNTLIPYSLTVKVYEYYNNTVQSNSSIILRIYNSRLRSISDYLMYANNQETYLITKMILNKLTNKYIYADESFAYGTNYANFIGFALRKITELEDGTKYDVLIQLYNNNTLLSTYNYLTYYNPSYDLEFRYINLSEILINEFSVANRNSATKVVVLVQENNIGNYDFIEIPIVRNVQGYNIVWLNEFGIYENYMFIDKASDAKLKQTTYQRKPNQYINSYDKGGTVITNATQQIVDKFWTNWINPSDVEYIAKSLATAKRVYLQSWDSNYNWTFEELKVLDVTSHFTSIDNEELQNVVLTVEREIYDNL